MEAERERVAGIEAKKKKKKKAYPIFIEFFILSLSLSMGCHFPRILCQKSGRENDYLVPANFSTSSLADHVEWERMDRRGMDELA